MSRKLVLLLSVLKHNSRDFTPYAVSNECESAGGIQRKGTGVSSARLMSLRVPVGCLVRCIGTN